MHSKKIALSLVLGMMISTSWAETVATADTITIVENKNTSQILNSSTETQVEIRVEDIDSPNLE
ncbi:hypothetical protein [Acinetobacter sp. ANC 4648]|uniref:hypothetical protein n=1 Tax=Acinetobacter sp. ANC 4648 TaxID=1977875 RepID=UPI000A32FBBA|nr:hypothetical protein [Acinetobacter sp. ANC 4648]OTG85090.1 hypothetical protein B9T27_02425 [Acinetobacter sp. ANC 4648]